MNYDKPLIETTVETDVQHAFPYDDTVSCCVTFEPDRVLVEIETWGGILFVVEYDHDTRTYFDVDHDQPYDPDELVHLALGEAALIIEGRERRINEGG